MPWTQVSVEIARCDVEEVAEFLDAAGALSVTSMDAGDEPLLEPGPGETPLWQRVRVVALLEPGVNTARLQAGLAEIIPDAAANLVVETLDDRDWSETWRDSFGPMRFGHRLWIVPTGEEVAAPDAVVVHLDPGLAFGTGTHATTALCLEWLDGHVPQGGSVVDYGCGSGILAIAARKLGAGPVYAVDLDPQALQATRVNAVRNGIIDGLTVQSPNEFSAGDVDLVIANILANPLIELAGRLSGLLAAGGHIIMTGILAEQAEDVMMAYQGVVDFAQPVHRDEWVLLTGRKR
ncbi:MAG: 50S ribosomal protein L11 methyltransferase [Gammaproteobacteria bacterium]